MVKIMLCGQTGLGAHLVTPACDVFTLHRGAHRIRHMKQEDSGSSAHTANIQLLLDLVAGK